MGRGGGSLALQASQLRQDPSRRDVFGAWYAVVVFGWTNIWNADKVSDGPADYLDFLKPEYKDKLVFTYPNDDDAVLYAFDLA